MNMNFTHVCGNRCELRSALLLGIMFSCTQLSIVCYCLNILNMIIFVVRNSTKCNKFTLKTKVSLFMPFLQFSCFFLFFSFFQLVLKGCVRVEVVIYKQLLIFLRGLTLFWRYIECEGVQKAKYNKTGDRSVHVC